MSSIQVGQENSAPIEIYYEDHGSGSPVVLIHGGPLNGDAWEKQTAALLAAGHRVITYDRRGFGRSSKPAVGYNFDTFAADLDALLSGPDLNGVALVGHSMGTGEVTRYIGNHGSQRLRNVVLIGAPGPYLVKSADNPEGVDREVFDGVRAGLKADRPAAVAAGSTKSFELSLAPGSYRFRIVEAAAQVDGEIGADCVIPMLVAHDGDLRIERVSTRSEIAIRNESDRSLVFVVEERNWAQDALTGERVIAMPAFRQLCPEQLLSVGDNADIGWIAVMFSDPKGSSELYDALGGARAYKLVRDHFAFLLERVRRNHGFVVKTVGAAVMAAFSRPDDAVRAALAIQDEIASVNSARGGGLNAMPIVLKLGMHAGPCIAVTTGGALDYFGATVNIAARLEHECRDGEVIVSEAVAQDADSRAALSGRAQLKETARLRGVSAPVRFVRVEGLPSAGRQVTRDSFIGTKPKHNRASESSLTNEI